MPILRGRYTLLWVVNSDVPSIHQIDTANAPYCYIKIRFTSEVKDRHRHVTADVMRYKVP